LGGVLTRTIEAERRAPSSKQSSDDAPSPDQTTGRPDDGPGSLACQGGRCCSLGEDPAIVSAVDRYDVASIGALVEEMESRVRSSLHEIYFGATHDVVNEIRPVVPAGYLRHQGDLQREMAERLKSRRLIE